MILYGPTCGSNCGGFGYKVRMILYGSRKLTTEDNRGPMFLREFGLVFFFLAVYFVVCEEFLIK